MTDRNQIDSSDTPGSDTAAGDEPTPRVGYRRPPTHSRFKPGQSGNPRGRPKGAINIDTLCRSLLSRKVTIQENGGRRKVSAVEAILLATIQRAVRDDNRAAKLLLELQQRLPTTGDAEAAGPSTDEDAAIIADFLGKRQEAEKLGGVSLQGREDVSSPSSEDGEDHGAG